LTTNTTSDDHQHKSHNPKRNNNVPIKEKKNQHRDTTKEKGNKNRTQKLKKELPKNCEKIDNKHCQKLWAHKSQHQAQKQGVSKEK
jgi:hypothetical protein